MPAHFERLVITDPEQTSASQTLRGQSFYFMRALNNDGGGGDNLDVGVILPDGTALAPIPIDGYVFTGTNLAEVEIIAGSTTPCGGSGDPAIASSCTPSARYRRWESNVGTIDQMLNDPQYLDDLPIPPDEATVLTTSDLFETPTNICDNCESELVAWFKAPMSGTYTFKIASDNNGLLDSAH